MRYREVKRGAVRAPTIFCWSCGMVDRGREQAGMFAPCDSCGSSDVHVTTSLAATRFSNADLEEMRQRGYDWLDRQP